VPSDHCYSGYSSYPELCSCFISAISFTALPGSSIISHQTSLARTFVCVRILLPPYHPIHPSFSIVCLLHPSIHPSVHPFCTIYTHVQVSFTVSHPEIHIVLLCLLVSSSPSHTHSIPIHIFTPVPIHIHIHIPVRVYVLIRIDTLISHPRLALLLSHYLIILSCVACCFYLYLYTYHPPSYDHVLPVMMFVAER
jgi:hypothetical protein